MILRAVTFPVRVTMHVTFALVNQWRAVTDPCEPFIWPDDEDDA